MPSSVHILLNSLKISNLTTRDIVNSIHFRMMKQKYEKAFAQIPALFGRVNTLTAKQCSETEPFRHVSTRPFSQSVILQIPNL